MFALAPARADATVAIPFPFRGTVSLPLLDLLAAGQRKNLSILAGWRFEQFGSDALDLVEGRLAFAITDGKLTITRIETEEANDDA